ncbi:MAG: ribonuclease H-like domain-containing protein [Thermodesulfovibrionia bacterium]|nr:ribonuclease H-like domain-containing protein [Thermodesulfovibrionia bacterium]
MAKKIVIDIETIGKDFETFDDMSKEYLLKFAKTEEEIQEAKESLAFSPLTGEIVAIGMLNPDTEKGAVFFQAPQNPPEPFEEKEIQFISDTEEGILRRFWDAVKHYDQIITFNGRGFDAPFLMLRSALLKISPTKELMPNRYSGTSHIDLLDHLTFFGSVRRKFSLHMWCKAFGIKSPKEEGVTGLEVNALFNKGKYFEIAQYCVGDLFATKELFEYWDKFVRLPPR